MSYVVALLLVLLQGALHVGAPAASRLQSRVQWTAAQTYRTTSPRLLSRVDAIERTTADHVSTTRPGSPEGGIRAARSTVVASVDRGTARTPLPLAPTSAQRRAPWLEASQRADDQSLGHRGHRSHAVAALGGVSPVFLTAPPRQR